MNELSAIIKSSSVRITTPCQKPIANAGKFDRKQPLHSQKFEFLFYFLITFLIINQLSKKKQILIHVIPFLCQTTVSASSMFLNFCSRLIKQSSLCNLFPQLSYHYTVLPQSATTDGLKGDFFFPFKHKSGHFFSTSLCFFHLSTWELIFYSRF